jgi:hypothetical protein
MRPRPIYLGVGECECGKLDARLYHVPGTELAARSVCSRCLEARGYAAPLPRTAEDIEMVDGKPEWRPERDTKPYPKVPEPHVGRLDLGHEHFFEVVIGRDDQLIGWLHTHPDARNPSVLCQSICAVRPINGAPVHQVICADPITLTPSLLCRTCGAHGNVVNGQWESI